MFGFKPKKIAIPAGASGQAAANDTDDETLESISSSTDADSISPEAAIEVQVIEQKTDETPDSMLDFTASQPVQTEESAGESSLADLFSGGSHEEEKSSLAAILERTPDASVEELIDDLNEIRNMLRGRLDEQ